MAEGILFDKAMAEAYLEQVNQMTATEMLCLAGVYYFRMYSHRPRGLRLLLAARRWREAWKKQAIEHQEATGDSMREDILAAIHFCATMAQYVYDGTYDDYCESNIMATVRADGVPQRTIRLVKGFKSDSSDWLNIE
jgi:hypothetical protein